MTLQRVDVIPVRDDFVARAENVDLTHPLSGDVFTVMRRALDEYSVLVIPGPTLNDEQQIAFSSLWGKMEPTQGTNPAAGTPFARQPNLDTESGDIIPASDRRMHYQRGNYLWHADSTFKKTPSLCSILSARQVPPQGGNTEFVSTRSAYERLDGDDRQSLDNMTVEDVVIWDNRSVLHRATAYDTDRYPRLMQRTTISNPDILKSPAYRRISNAD